ncbi:MAG: exopolysaccharide biosynthesis protein [Verrucomicrobiota bacterium]|nr:exopolysaccharide biosynthesis protein [Verrucomicrobiota bacterium]
MCNILNNTQHTLTEELKQLLQNNTGELSIGDICSAINDKGFGLLLIILSLPSALPIPAPGYSTPFGIAIALIGIQMLGGGRTIWLPKKINAFKIKSSVASKMIQVGTRFIQELERFIRPRIHAVYSGVGYTLAALLIIIMALLMILPIPLTNTFPAMVIFLIGVGLTEKDGLFGIIAYSIGICAVTLYVLIIYTLVTRGLPAVEGIRDWLTNVFSL